MVLKILEEDKNYNDNWSVSSAVLSAFLSSLCCLTSGYDGGNSHQIWRVVSNMLNKH